MTPAQKRRLERAKQELRRLYGRDDRPGKATRPRRAGKRGARTSKR